MEYSEEYENDKIDDNEKMLDKERLSSLKNIVEEELTQNNGIGIQQVLDEKLFESSEKCSIVS